MVVVVLTAVPPGLRGHLTRWLLEIAPGVYVGHASQRVREHMWDRIVELLSEGRALMVYTVRAEQRLAFLVHGHDWTPEDHDGITLIRRPTDDYVASPERLVGATPQSAAVRRRRAKRMKFKPR